MDTIELLIPITDNKINAKNLYDFLEIKVCFYTWMREHIIEYQNAKHINVVLAPHSKYEYIITIDMAKRLSIAQNNSKGQKAFAYFIQWGKDVHELVIHQTPDVINITQRYQINKNPGYITVPTFCRVRNVNTSLKLIKILDDECAKMCDVFGIYIENVSHTQGGYISINSYPVEVLEECYDELMKGT